MTLWFTVNLAFWQLLKQYKLKLAKMINPDMKRIEQTFLVKLFDNDKGPLKLPSVLPDIVRDWMQMVENSDKVKQNMNPYFPNMRPIF